MLKVRTPKEAGGERRSFADLLESAGLTPADVQVRHGVSISTVYRARKGVVPRRLYLKALASALGVTEAECRAAIKAGQKGGAA